MSSALSAVPVGRRRTAAAVLGGFAALLAVVGVLGLVDSPGAVVTVLAGVALAAAVLLALVAWGVLASIGQDLGERELDAAVAEAVAAAGRSGGWTCDCGHDHDPDELHTVDRDGSEAASRPPGGTDACSHDGSGAACAHDCASCVLTGLRQAPSVG